MAAYSSNDASLFHCVSIYNRRAKQLKDIQLCVTHGPLGFKMIMLHHQTDFFKTLTRKKSKNILTEADRESLLSCHCHDILL